MAAAVDSREIFNNLSYKFSQLLYTRTEGDRNVIDKTLNELNALNYRQPVIANTSRAVLLIHNCCTLILPDDSSLVGKSCQLITNLIDKQHVLVEGRTLSLAIEWSLQALTKQDESVSVDVLYMLDVLLRSNIKNITSHMKYLVNPNSILLKLAENRNNGKLALLAIRCLEDCTLQPEDSSLSSDQKEIPIHRNNCVHIFMKYLLAEKNENFDYIHYYKIIISSLRGLENVISQDPQYLKEHLEYIFGIIKCFMVYQINGVNFPIPERIRPSTLSIPDPATNTPREKKGGKIARQRKTRWANKKNKNTVETRSEESIEKGRYIPASGMFDSNSEGEIPQKFYANYARTSDSDFSDSQHHSHVKLNLIAGKIRQSSLQLFLSVIKVLDKRTIFSYWSSFVPDGFPYAFNTLATCILKDPSPKGRMAGLNVLLALISRAKLYLSLAEYSDKTTAFTPFAMVIGSMMKELHRILILALNENSLPVLLQVLKCLAALIQASPYSKLDPGMISKIVRNIKGYIYHRDSSVQIATLIVLGCVLASEPVVLETREIFLRQLPQRGVFNEKIGTDCTELNPKEDEGSKLDEDIEFARFSSSSEDEDEVEVLKPSCVEVPWLLARCLNNLGVSLKPGTEVEYVSSTPVKLESLQIISVMSRNYFDSFMASHMGLITKALAVSMTDKYPEVKLHAGKAVDFLGQAMNHHFSAGLDSSVLSINQGLAFWQSLLNGPLMTMLQNEELPSLKMVGCDCIGSIGSQIFDRLSRDKQLFIISVLFSYAQDLDKNVKAAAVRALAICVIHPSQREDIGFVIDTAEAILKSLEDNCVAVRIKSSWSLGNLSDALVLIREHSLSRSDPTYSEEIPSSLLLRLIEESIKGCKDTDKIRTNALRALGNLFQLITYDLLKDKKFREIVDVGINCLVDNCTSRTNMKVRWNACYAIGNILKNQVLYEEAHAWQDSVFNTLMDIVVNFRNFKVRINAALALSGPVSRKLYNNYFFPIWNSLIKALENSYQLQDFSEYKHRDHLVDQICLTIGHLITMLNLEDVSNMKDNLQTSVSILAMHMNDVMERVVPEKLTTLVNATTHLTSLIEKKNLNGEERDVLTQLNEVFIPGV